MQAHGVLSLGPRMPSSGSILNNQKAMEYNSQTGVLSCTFNFMQLEWIKMNSDMKATEVTESARLTITSVFSDWNTIDRYWIGYTSPLDRCLGVWPVRSNTDQ